MNNTELIQCHNKKKFKDKALADLAARRKRGRVSYMCPWCRSWHVGSDSGPRSDSKRAEPFKRTQFHWREAVKVET